MTRLLVRIPSFCLGLALQIVAATVALKGSVVADDDFPVAPIEIVHGGDRKIVDCRETVGDDVADQLLQHLLLLGGADLLIGSDVEIVSRDTAARVVLLFSLFTARIRVMNQVVVAMADVHAGFAGVQRLLARRGKELLETGPREYDRLPDGRPYDGRPWWQA